MARKIRDIWLMARKLRDHWLMVVLVAGLGLAYVLLLGYLLLGNLLGLKAEATGAPLSPVLEPVGLWDVSGQALEAARAQAADAQLVSASIHWCAANESALRAGAGSWTFVFYSRSSGHSLDVVVNGGVARVVNQTPAWVVPSSIAEGSWQEGPGDAMLAFLACGGCAFLDQHPHAVVDVHLAGDGQGGAAWTVVALDAGERSLFSVLVDAGSGEVLSTDSS